MSFFTEYMHCIPVWGLRYIMSAQTLAITLDEAVPYKSRLHRTYAIPVILVDVPVYLSSWKV